MVTSHASECEEGVEEGELTDFKLVFKFVRCDLAKPNQMAASSAVPDQPPFPIPRLSVKKY